MRKALTSLKSVVVDKVEEAYESCESDEESLKQITTASDAPEPSLSPPPPPPAPLTYGTENCPPKAGSPHFGNCSDYSSEPSPILSAARFSFAPVKPMEELIVSSAPQATARFRSRLAPKPAAPAGVKCSPVKERVRRPMANSSDFITNIDNMIKDIMAVANREKPPTGAMTARRNDRPSSADRGGWSTSRTAYRCHEGSPEHLMITGRKSVDLGSRYSFGKCPLSDGVPRPSVNSSRSSSHQQSREPSREAEEAEIKTPARESLSQVSVVQVEQPRATTPFRSVTARRPIRRDVMTRSNTVDVVGTNDAAKATDTFELTPSVMRELQLEVITANSRDALARQWYARFNTMVFDGKLPTQLPISWNSRFTKSSGRTTFEVTERRRSSLCDSAGQELDDGGRPRPATRRAGAEPRTWTAKQIELSVKFITNVERLMRTLLHEMCHVAQRVLADQEDPSEHGPLFVKWMSVAARRCPLVPVSLTHDYAAATNAHTWVCPGCKHVERRLTKSIAETPLCASCQRPLRPKNAQKRAPSEYNRFYQENYARLVNECGDKREAMKRVAQLWNARPKC